MTPHAGLTTGSLVSAEPIPLPAQPGLSCSVCGRPVGLSPYGPGHAVSFARLTDADRHRAKPRS